MRVVSKISGRVKIERVECVGPRAGIGRTIEGNFTGWMKFMKSNAISPRTHEESFLLHQGPVAQWIRRRSTEPEIPGSIPGRINFFFFFLRTWRDVPRRQLRPHKVSHRSEQCGGVGGELKASIDACQKTFANNIKTLIPRSRRSHATIAHN